MSEAKKQQEMTVPLMDDTAFGSSLKVPYMDDGPSEENRNSNDELAVSRGTENLRNIINEFIPGLWRFYKNIYGERGTSAIISSDIKDDINMFILWLGEHGGAGEKWTEDDKKATKLWLPDWNMFLQARTGETLVTCWNLCLTTVGFIFYITDLGSDIGTCIYYASNGQWWRSVVTLAVVYAAIIIHTAIKWNDKDIHCTGTADWLRYVASSLVNWPDVKQYGALCLLEWKLYKSPASSARLMSEWHVRRYSVACLKFTEGVCEACPQVMLQLYLLVPDLYEDWTWTDYLRIAGASISLCTAGAALVNREKSNRINNYTDLLLSELVVLHMWAIPLTVSRLLSVALLLTVHPYWALAGVALHLLLCGVYWCRTVRGPRTLVVVIRTCLDTLQFSISPFAVAGSITYRRVYHAIHFLVNTAAMVVWALGTPLACAHPALYTVIICFNAVMFAVGLVVWQLHENYWPHSYKNSD